MASCTTSIAHLLLTRGDHQRGGIQAIHDHLAEAFAISVSSGHVGTIADSGFLLAQVMAMRGLIDEALTVLGQAEAARNVLVEKIT